MDPEGANQTISAAKIREDIDIAYKLGGVMMLITFITMVILYFVLPDMSGEPGDMGIDLDTFFLMLIVVGAFTVFQIKFMFRLLFGNGVIDLRNMDSQEIMGSQSKGEFLAKARSTFFGKMIVLCAFSDAIMIYGMVFLILSIFYTNAVDLRFGIFVLIALLSWSYTGRLKDSIDIKP